MPEYPEKYKVYYANRRIEKALEQLPPNDFERIDVYDDLRSVIILAVIHRKNLERYLRKGYVPELSVNAAPPVIASDRRERSNLLTCQTRLLRRYAPRNDSTTDTFGIYPFAKLDCDSFYRAQSVNSAPFCCGVLRERLDTTSKSVSNNQTNTPSPGYLDSLQLAGT